MNAAVFYRCNIFKYANRLIHHINFSENMLEIRLQQLLLLKNLIIYFGGYVVYQYVLASYFRNRFYKHVES